VTFFAPAYNLGAELKDARLVRRLVRDCDNEVQPALR